MMLHKGVGRVELKSVGDGAGRRRNVAVSAEKGEFACHHSDDGRDAHDMNLFTGTVGMAVSTLSVVPDGQDAQVR
jgi:hypothetical protein